MSELLDEWLLEMEDHKASNSTDDPCYYLEDIRQHLITTSHALSFKLGTGEQLLRDLLPTITQLATFEVIIVTCFYAKGNPSQSALASALEELSSRARCEQLNVRVRICFSSVSSTVCEKISRLFSKNHHYASSCWEDLFGLSPFKLSNLDLQISSIFVPPLSVMHPKFVVIDRKHAFLPSCNISWEDWLEGCIELRGPVVLSLIRFWENFWTTDEISALENTRASADSSFGSTGTDEPLLRAATTNLPQDSPQLLANSMLDLEEIQTVLLPSPHHVNPQFRLVFPAAVPPPTPLNIFLLTSFRKATKSIYVQSPNFTSSPALSALYGALKNGVDVRIVTSTRMMMMEQVITAGTISELSIMSLKRKYSNLLKAHQKDCISDPEAGRRTPGQLSVNYYTAKEGNSDSSEPVKSHLKLTIVDDEVVVLGSGNMDRASWYTSQELGIAFFSKKLAQTIKTDVDNSLQGRLISSST